MSGLTMHFCLTVNERQGLESLALPFSVVFLGVVPGMSAYENSSEMQVLGLHLRTTLSEPWVEQSTF